MRTFAMIVECAAAVLLVSSLVFAYWGFGEGFDKDKPVKVAQAIVLCCWILLPPMWFALERWMRSKDLASNDKTFDRFKYNQDLASKIWLALVSVLLILYFGKDLIRAK